MAIPQTFVGFLRDLAGESLSSKTDILKLGGYLGFPNLVSTVNVLMAKHHSNIRGSTSNFLTEWNDLDESTQPIKLEKLRQAYCHLEKEGIFSRVLQRYSSLTVGLQVSHDSNQMELAVPIVPEMTREQICSQGRNQAFVIDLLAKVTTHSNLCDLAITCGIEVTDVEAQQTNWPRNIQQATLEVMLPWWEGSNKSDVQKIGLLKHGFTSMQKPAVFNRVAVKYNIVAPPDEQLHHSESMDVSSGLELGGEPGSDSTAESTVQGALLDSNLLSGSINMLDMCTIRSEFRNLSIGPQTDSLGNGDQHSPEFSTGYSCPREKIPAKVLIINNICEETKHGEQGGLRIPGRHEKATDQLTAECLKIGYDVTYHRDIDRNNMISLKEDLRTFDFSEYNMFMCVVVCHCNIAGTLLDRNKDLAIQFTDYVKFCSENQTLVGKPKIFFKNACRGGSYDEGTISLGPDGFGQRHLPQQVDIAIAYPTAEGHRYLLNTKEGHQSPIEALAMLLTEDAIQRPRTLNTLFLRWKRMLSETIYRINGDSTPYKQTACVHDTLRDDVYY